MSTRHLVTVVALMGLAGCGDSTLAGTEVDFASPQLSPAAPAAMNAGTRENAQLARLHSLQAAFHGALNSQDLEAFRSLWTEDATVTAGGNTFTGPDEIAAFVSNSGPFVNGWASLAPAYKTEFEIHGNTANFQFECVYVEESGNLTGSPVEAHLNATGTMRKVGDEWLFQTFVAGAGSL
jgi:ketosteroid isomerase-like protein